MKKSPYEIAQEEEAIRAQKELDEILIKDKLTPIDLWTITDDNFYLWTEKNYYPKLLQHFRDNFTDFEAWQKTWFLEDKKIIKFGITKCLEGKSNIKNPYKYIIERSNYNSSQTFVSEDNLDGFIKHGGPYFTFTHKKLDSFIPYLTWIRIRRKIPSKSIRGSNLISLKGKSSYNSPFVEVQILNDFTLLKMGGIIVPVNQHGLLNSKVMEFVNLDNTIFKGRLPSAGRELAIRNSFLDNLIIGECDLSLATFYRCSINNMNIVNSKIQQVNFIECSITGDISDSELSRINIVGGYFNAPIRNSKLFRVEAHEGESNQSFGDCFKNLKTAYSSQGDDKKSMEYLIKEKEYNRYSHLNSFKQVNRHLFFQLLNSKSKIKVFPNYLKKVLKSQKSLIKFIFHSLNYHYWGYGTKPSFVIRNSILAIIIFSILYLLKLVDYSVCNLDGKILLDAINISLSSFSTLGYFVKSSNVEIINESLIIFESLMGAVNIGAFIGSLVIQKY